jgi:hypothetical protein
MTQRIRKNYKTISIHIAACIGFLCMPFLFSPDFPREINLFRIRGFREDFIFHMLLVIFFYFNYYYLSDKLFFRKKYLLYVFVLACTLLLIEAGSKKIGTLTHISYKKEMKVQKPMFSSWKHKKPRHYLFGFDFGRHFFQFILLLTITVLLKINQKRKQVEDEKTELELSFLKTQIQPHFLFNTLNSIYALALERSDLTPYAIVKLSGMMRYVLLDTEMEFVSLQNEINYISNYIDLQKLRLTDNVQLEYKATGDFAGLLIAPMILITFVENAFKFGVNPEESSSIRIFIKVEKNKLILYVWNNKVVIPAFDTRHLGIENTKKRLDSLYTDRYTLEINDQVSYHEMTLTMQLQ